MLDLVLMSFDGNTEQLVCHICREREKRERERERERERV